MFEQEFRQTLYLSGVAATEIDANWQQLSRAYQSSSRHYHTLAHLDHMVEQLRKVKEKISDWNTLVYSIAYHDVVYNVLRKDNEEKSAVHAVKKLREFKYDLPKTDKCSLQILSTKTHMASEDSDTNFFTDADLSILGADEAGYNRYVGQIRKEYRYYPDMLYNPGRVKVLQHFLDMPAIFKTPDFAALYEGQARENLSREIEQLQQ